MSRSARSAGTERAAWAVRQEQLPTALGSVELRLGDDRRAKISYSTYPQARGRGLAARAVDLVCFFAFEELGIVRVQLLTDADNSASRAVATKAGFTIEGILRARGEREGKRYDMVLYSRLSTDAADS